MDTNGGDEECQLLEPEPHGGKGLHSDSDTDEEGFFTRRRRRGCCLILIIICVLCAATGVFTMFLNKAAQQSLEALGAAALGVHTGVGSVSIALFSTRSEIWDVRVATVPGFGTDDFLDMGDSVFDFNAWSLLAKPFDLEELGVSNLFVSIDKRGQMSNVQKIVDHVNKFAEQAKQPASTAKLQVPGGPQTLQDDIHTMTSKIIADRVSFKNISTSVCLHPLCDATAPATFTLREILIKEVGTNNGGVYLYEFVQIIVHAIVNAIIRAAPAQIGQNLMAGMHGSLQKALDYASVHYDVGGGLQKVGEWASKEFDLLDNATTFAGQVLGDFVGNATSAAGYLVGHALEKAAGKTGVGLKSALGNETEGAGEEVNQAIDNATAKLGDELHEFGQDAGDFFAGLGKKLTKRMVEKTSDAVHSAVDSDASGAATPTPAQAPGTAQ